MGLNMEEEEGDVDGCGASDTERGDWKRRKRTRRKKEGERRLCRNGRERQKREETTAA